MTKLTFLKQEMFFVILTTIIPLITGCAYPSTHVYLTWQDDPHTTITINTHTTDKVYPVEVMYKPTSVGSENELIAEGVVKQLSIVNPPRTITVFHLTNLSPGTTYTFKMKNNNSTYSKTFKFKTIPKDGTPLRFIVGGDMGILPSVPKLLQQAKKFSPLFVVIGGDIAYANGNPQNDWMWDIWFTNWEKYMVNDDGCLIPIIAGIGNHEVNDNGQSAPPEERAPFYFNYFTQGGKTYFARIFEPYLLLIVLDSNHLISVSDQTDWLKTTINRNYPYIICTYHVPMYPSHRSFEGTTSAEERNLWLPLFDNYKVSVCFENHDHTFKRTKILKNNQPSSEGTVYLGDGCFGVIPREIKNFDLGYLEKADSKRHFWVVDISKEKLTARAVDEEGIIFDEISLPPRTQPQNTK